MSKIYRVTIRPDITDEQVAQMMAGILIDGRRPCPPMSRSCRSTRTVPSSKSRLRRRNRQIRKMCEALGLGVARLKRTAIGPVKLGMLQQGNGGTSPLRKWLS